MSFKKVLLFTFVTFFLFGCGDSSTNETSEVVETDSDSETVKTAGTAAGLRHYPGKDFNMKIPASWNLVTDNENAVPTPKRGKIELAVTSPETKGGFANNLIILSQVLGSYSSSKDYSIVNNVGAENEYFNYAKISGKDFSFADGEKTMLYVFEAKYGETTPLLKFIQTAYVCNNNHAFFLTIALPTDIKNTSKYEAMLKTFECK